MGEIRDRSEPEEPPRKSALERGREQKSARFGRPVRIAIGLLLVVGGILGFLPILGFWMIPIGLAILAADVPAAARLRDRLRAAASRVMRPKD